MLFCVKQSCSAGVSATVIDLENATHYDFGRDGESVFVYLTSGEKILVVGDDAKRLAACLTRIHALDDPAGSLMLEEAIA